MPWLGSMTGMVGVQCGYGQGPVRVTIIDRDPHRGPHQIVVEPQYGWRSSIVTRTEACIRSWSGSTMGDDQ